MSYLIKTIAGSILGQTIADAVAVKTNGKSTSEIESDFPNCYDDDFIIDYPYTKVTGRYPLNDWSAATDQCIVMINSIADNFHNRTINIRDLAGKLHYWARNGFPEIGDATGIGIDQKTHLATSRTKFLENPLLSTKEMWDDSNCIPDNGAIVRTIPLAFIGNIDDVVRNTIMATRVTHHDPRCESAAVLINTILWTILQLKKYKEEKSDSSNLSVDRIIDKNIKHIGPLLPSEYMEEFRYYLNCEFHELHLNSFKNNMDEIHHVFKTVGAALFALRLTEGDANTDYKRIISILATTGGDTSINCAVAGALVGAVIGFDGIPVDWFNALPNRRWVNIRVAQLKSRSAEVPLIPPGAANAQNNTQNNQNARRYNAERRRMPLR